MLPSRDSPVPESNKPSDPPLDLPSNLPSLNLPSKSQPDQPLSQQSDLPGSPSELPLPYSTLTSLFQSLKISLENLNPARNLLILLVSLSPIGLMLRILSLNTNTQLNGSIFRVMDQITTYESNVFLSVVAALSYALNYRKMKNPLEIAKLLLQVLVTFPLILFLCEARGWDRLR